MHCILPFVILVVVELGLVESLEVGDVCEPGESCGHLEICHEGRCTCSPDVHMIPVFSNVGNQAGVKCLEKKKCDYTTRPRQLCGLAHCVLEEGQFHGVCSCDENQMLTVNSIDNDTCWPMRKRKFNDYCDHASPICDEMRGLRCRGRNCLCKDEDYYNFTTERCFNKKVFKEYFGVDEYLGRWGDYCIRDVDCLGILECAFNNTCECPWDCDGYIKEHNSCYCGDWEVPVFPIIVGVLCGLLITCFWCYQINKLCKKYETRPHESEQTAPQVRYEEVQHIEEVSSPAPPESDPPPQYELIPGNTSAPSAPPLPSNEEDRTSVNKSPVLLRKRKLPTSSADPQPTKM